MTADPERDMREPIGRPTPTGEVTFLFTDLEGSTRAWESAPELMNASLARHDELLRGAIGDADGVIFSEAGDAFAGAFQHPADAVAAAVAAQQRLAREDWPGGYEPSVRMGLHVGESFERADNYYGPTLNRAARIMSCAHGGQIVCSADVVDRLADLQDGVSLRPLGSFVLKDVSGPVAISQVVVEGLRSEFPSLNTLDRHEIRVPRSRTTFIGREAEMADLSERLSAGGIVTIVAAGGTGKTRLSHEVALASAGFFPGGVHLVELEDIGSAQVGDRTATTVLGDQPLARAEGGGDLAAAALDRLRTRRALVIFDNCEHVLDAVAEVVETLASNCPDLSILSSSRERLGVIGEQVIPLQPLSVGPLERERSTTTDPDGRSLAAQLFIDRARGADPDFDPSGDEMVLVEQICRAVDGLPLAIELAASRIRTLTLDQVDARLGDALSILKESRSRRSERHRSLEATIAWSNDLLEPTEQQMLAWCAVFASGFSLDAFVHLSAAANSAGHTDADGVDLLESLTDKSLVHPERRDGVVRYRLTAPIRQFALRRLDDRGERRQAELAHVEYFRHLGRQTSDELGSGPSAATLHDLRSDNDNFITAVRRAAELDDRSRALAMALGLHTYWEETGNLAQASDLIESVLGDDLADPMTFRGFGILLAYAPMCGKMPLAASLAELLTPALDQPLPPKLAGNLRFTLGFLHSARGDLDVATETWRDAGEVLLGHDDLLARQALFNAGHSSAHDGRWEDARAYLDEAAAVPPPVQAWFPDLSRVTRLLIDIHAGEERVEEMVDAAETVDTGGLRFRLMLATIDASVGLFEAGEPVAAERWWRSLLDIGLGMGNVWAALFGLEFAAWSELARGDDERAAELWGCVDRFADERGYGWWRLTADGGVRRRLLVQDRSPEVYELAGRSGATRLLHDEVKAVLRSAPLQDGATHDPDI